MRREADTNSRIIAALVFLAVAVLTSLGQSAVATVQPNALIADGTVLQQAISVPIWGKARDGEQVTVSFQNQKVTTTALGGRWMLRLNPLQPGGPFTMTILGDNVIVIENILVGEVWICSGQSNMEWPLAKTTSGKEAGASAKDSMLKLFTMPTEMRDFPARELTGGKWQESAPDTASDFSAVGYYFGRDLRKALKVPVGLIHASLGATVCQAWTSRRVLMSDKESVAELENPPSWTQWLDARNRFSCLYNGMIAPMIPYAIRGVIWYQGESNAIWGSAFHYRELFPMMIRNWREDWNQGDFPFLFVQLAPFQKIVSEPQNSDWALLRESQLLTSLTVPNTAMAVITDVGDEVEIHPKRKEPVGARLALAAEAVAYGRQVVYQGPTFKSMVVRRDRAVVTFGNAKGGLVVKGETVAGFTISGPDKKFHNAKAEVGGSKVVVWSPDVAHPVAVRYGWADYPVVNLYNKSGLPASPFRTDRDVAPIQPKQF